MFKVDAGDFLFGGADASAISVESCSRAIDHVRTGKIKHATVTPRISPSWISWPQ
jgi:hypothetical protein